MLGDLNGWIGDRVRASITGAFGVPGEYENERIVVEFGVRSIVLDVRTVREMG